MASSNGDTLTKSFPKVLQNIPPATVLILSDEAHFHLSSTVKKQNFRSLDSPRVTVWCVVLEFDVWGPYFFGDKLNNGQLTGKTSSMCVTIGGRHLEEIISKTK
ncbi:hypothetical protein TNCV_3499391 [Trichonephila clavipes]|nr:hypothetical protein TNCV_3499391 [Trichonephila clavipes]